MFIHQLARFDVTGVVDGVGLSEPAGVSPCARQAGKRQDPLARAHVRSLIEHYTEQLGKAEVLDIPQRDPLSKDDAYGFGPFFISIIDAMAADIKNEILVLGAMGNTEMIPDIHCEVGLFLANRGWGGVWHEICEEA